MSDYHLAPLRAAYVAQMQRAYRVSSRGIPTPEQRREWADDADALIAAHDRETAARALAPIRAALANHPTCDVYPDDDPVTCGWKRAVHDIQTALDGDHAA